MLVRPVDEAPVEAREDRGLGTEPGGLRQRVRARQYPPGRGGDRELQSGLQELREITA
jgi:hypothetical protein